MRLQFRNGFKKHESQVFEIITFPKFGIGQRAFLIQTQDDATVEIIKSLGGLRAIAISHPHYYSTNSQWSEAFGGVPGYEMGCLRARKREVLGGQNIPAKSCFYIQVGILLVLKSSTGLMELNGGVFYSLEISYSVPNYLPLSSSHAKRINQLTKPWDFERLYGVFQDREIEENAKSCVVFSLQRYIDWLSLDDAAA
ncbi:hypothetical protein SELMODRAFT_424957 [Selaginella moellendorffii]|uniref:Metallo-beta-lactamase domain-containing protein n=1 Tax=Selaginella moellendorffii TaxID=88036 RepID=D8SRJ4_SELML|nr:hypothetical protein SELMODRAFT_424957 [Selaginella moellendorffii]